MRIPKRFRLLGQEYTVEVLQSERWPEESDCVGIFRPNTHEIILRHNKSRSAIEHAFLHELNHAILNAMGRDKLYKDEAFVDLQAALLHQALTGN
jgi:hypothetical protein